MNGNPSRTDLRALDKAGLEKFFLENGEKRFRAGQVYEWLWKKGCLSFDEMTNLPKSTRQLLQDHFSFHTARPDLITRSKDGTVKTAFSLHDGKMVEAVLIPSGQRMTVCLSSQVGCAMGCHFCATGQLGFSRNLTVGEILDQLNGMKTPASRISNIVFMGMGEPFLNYRNLLGAIDRITATDGLAMSPQRITVSSIGIPRMIRRMADDDPKYHFALSLHAPTDGKRNRIIPFNLKFPLAELSQALQYYHRKTSRRVTIEYILLGGFNDTPADARDLAVFCRDFPVKINLIEYNPVEGKLFKKSDPADAKAFTQYLEGRNMVVHMRQSKGKDIEAACGQLAVKQQNRTV